MAFLLKTIPNLNPIRSFRAGIAASFGIAVFSLTIILSMSTGFAVRTRIEQDIVAEMETLSAHLASELDQGMFERYQGAQITVAALQLAGDTLSIPEQRDKLEILQSTLPDYSWIGIANPDGIVRASTGQILEGVDVSLRPWFSGAFEAPFVGDVHGALLLEPYLNLSGEPLRLVDISMPIFSNNNDLLGILGIHLNWEWAQNAHDLLLTDDLRARGISLYIIGENNDILIQTDTNSNILSLGDIRNAQMISAAVTTLENGERYLVGYSETTGYRDYPGLGWRVIATQPTSIAFRSARQLTRQILLIGSIIGLIFLVIGWFLARWTTRPLTLIADAANKIQQGNLDVTIPQLNDNQEITILSNSLKHMVDELRYEITMRKKTQDELQTQGEMLNSILSAIPVLIIQLNDRQQVEYINQHGMTVLGWESDDIMSLYGFVNSLYPDPGTRDEVLQAFASDDSDWQAFDTCHKENTKLYISWASVHLSQGGLLLIGIDLTERRQLQEAVEQSEALQAILETRTQGVLLVNSDNKIMRVNRYIEDKFGYSREDLVGQNAVILVPETVRTFHKNLCEEYMNNPTQRPMGTGRDLEAVRADGTQFPIEVSLSPIKIVNENHIVVFLADISTRKKLEDQRKKTELLRVELEQERILQELQGNFAQLVSHEFRTPLAVINSSADLLLRYFGQIDENRMREKLNKVQQQVELLVDLIDASIHRTDTVTTTPQITNEILDLNVTINGIISVIQTENQYNHHIKAHIEGTTITTDEALFNQILYHTLLNAAKYSPHNSDITTTVKLHDKHCHIEIKDQGIGIGDKDIEHIYKPFYRSNDVGTIPGTGLGLTIAKRNTNLLGGKILVESELGHGTTVTITLPLTLQKS